MGFFFAPPSGALANAASNTAAQYHNLWFHVYLPVLGGTFFVVYLVIFFVTARYRRRRATVGGFPEQKEEKSHMEILYAVVLACIAGVLYYFLFTTERTIDAVAANPTLKVNVIGYQWQWRFVYPSTNTVVDGKRIGTKFHYPTLVVPQNETVQFNLTSRDVVHAFWIPSMRFKRDANPNMINVFDLTFPKAGFFTGRCAEFCGLYHTLMRFRVLVLPAPKFHRWLESHRGASL